MKFIDLSAQQERIRDKIESNILKVLDHGQYIMGPEVRELEDVLKKFAGVKYAIACASGTDALLLALMSKEVGPGDAVFTTPFTFIATAEVISLLGAIPVFVDIDPVTFNIDPYKLEQAISALKAGDSTIHPLPTARYPVPVTPRGIIAVDLFGLTADYDVINAISGQHGLFVIEDAAQSFGAEYKGKMSCSLAEIACTSFFPAKPFGCYGDGGMCFTSDTDLAEIIKSLRVHGNGNHKYDNVRIGINGRLDTLQAAIMLAKFEIFPEELELRNQVAKKYSDLLSSISRELKTPFVPDAYKSVWAQYSLLAQDENHRLTLQNRLKKADIPTVIYYPKPLHLQAAFKNLGYKKGDFPVCENISDRIFSLPMHPYLIGEEQKHIVDIMSEK